MGFKLWVFFIFLVLGIFLAECSGQRINVLLTGQIHESANPLQAWFSAEPLVNYLPVPSKDPWGLLGGDVEMRRFIRLYFPRTWEGIRGFDFILLSSPVVYLFTDQQLNWMYDALGEGAGGLNTASIMSSEPDIHGAWVASVLQTAFPNDAPAVMANHGGATSTLKSFHVRINREFPEPVLTPFIPLGIEGFVGEDSRFIIMREGAAPMAWQVGNFPGFGDVPYLTTWRYKEGITITLGDYFGAAFWSSYRGTATDNKYAPDMLMNLILYATGREVPTEVEIFHRARFSFLDFRARMAVLLSLKDFVEKFNANPIRIEKSIGGLEGLLREAGDLYIALDFQACEEVMSQAFDEFSDAEQLVKEIKNAALLWIYIIEWLTTTSTLMVSGFVLWSLMIKRKLYRAVNSTRSI